MANGVVCSRMCAQLVVTFRHPNHRKPHIKGFGYKNEIRQIFFRKTEF